MPSSLQITRCLHSLRSAVLLALATLLPACSGCDVNIERSPDPEAKALFRWLLAGGTRDDGAFLVALQENGANGPEAVFVSLEEGSRTCSFGPAFWANTVQQSILDNLEGHGIDDRPARILTIDGDAESWTGTFRAFDASCKEVMSIPDVQGYASWWYGDEGREQGTVLETTDERLIYVDPWAGTSTPLAEHVTAHGKMTPTLVWTVEDGALVLRDLKGNALTKVGSNVTEVAPSSDGSEVAYLDDGALFVMKLEGLTPEPIAAKGTACMLHYQWLGNPGYSFLDDCATGELAILDRATGEKKVYSSAVTVAYGAFKREDQVPWLFFVREPQGGEPELWTVAPGSAPVFVGLSPEKTLYSAHDADKHGFFVTLDDDGESGTLGTWSLETGFHPLLERASRSWRSNGHLVAITERAGDIGTLIGLDLGSLDETFRAEDVNVFRLLGSSQVQALGYIRDWDTELGAGTFEVWVQANGEVITVDEGVNAFTELYWPRAGAAYSVRTPGREGLWTAYAE